MFCQHTEPAVYYTCRVSSCDDLKLGEYTTQDTFRILNKKQKLTIFPLILVLERKTRCFIYHTFLGGIHWQALPRVSTSPGLPMNTTKK